jgi:hypothetical protein
MHSSRQIEGYVCLNHLSLKQCLPEAPPLWPGPSSIENSHIAYFMIIMHHEERSPEKHLKARRLEGVDWTSDNILLTHQVDLVTETDKACEEVIFKSIQDNFPSHKVRHSRPSDALQVSFPYMSFQIQCVHVLYGWLALTSLRGM